MQDRGEEAPHVRFLGGGKVQGRQGLVDGVELLVVVDVVLANAEAAAGRNVSTIGRDPTTRWVVSNKGGETRKIGGA